MLCFRLTAGGSRALGGKYIDSISRIIASVNAPFSTAAIGYKREEPFGWDDWDFGSDAVHPLSVAPATRHIEHHIGSDLLYGSNSTFTYSKKNLGASGPRTPSRIPRGARKSVGLSQESSVQTSRGVFSGPAFASAANTQMHLASSSNFDTDEVKKLIPRESCRTIDAEKMPFGMHKGKKLEDMPSKYCKWLRDQGALDDRPNLLKALEDLGKFSVDESVDTDNTPMKAELGSATQENKNEVKCAAYSELDDISVRIRGVKKLKKKELIEKLSIIGLDTSGLKPVLCRRLVEWEKSREEETEGGIYCEESRAAKVLLWGENAAKHLRKRCRVLKMKKSEIKQEVETLGLDGSGLKPALVERLADHWKNLAMENFVKVDGRIVVNSSKESKLMSELFRSNGKKIVKKPVPLPEEIRDEVRHITQLTNGLLQKTKFRLSN
eukprot:g1839.t1